MSKAKMPKNPKCNKGWGKELSLDWNEIIVLESDPEPDESDIVLIDDGTVPLAPG